MWKAFTDGEDEWGNTSLGQAGYVSCFSMAAAFLLDPNVACYIKVYSVTFLINYTVSPSEGRYNVEYQMIIDMSHNFPNFCILCLGKYKNLNKTLTTEH